MDSMEDMLNALTQGSRQGGSGTVARRRSAKFVTFHPRDSGDYLDDVFFEDPEEFVPLKNNKGEVKRWGLTPYTEPLGLPDVDGLKIQRRVMMTQTLYGDDMDYPPNQFVKALVKRKAEKLAALDLGRLKHRDYILHLTMPLIPLNYVKSPEFLQRLKDVKPVEGERMIYRKFRVSGGINLDTFQDKVLQPIMGWVRNLHAFVFTDLTDGALFGPKDATTVDSMHKGQTGYEYLDAAEYTLAHLVQEKGARFEYMYDFGDHFYHNIEVEEILPEEESDGHVEVLGGRGMCPPENGDGNWSWAESLYEYKFGTPYESSEVMKTLFQAPNYKGQPIVRFDPLTFSVSQAQSRLTTALASKASLRKGGRVYNIPMNPFSDSPGNYGPKGTGGAPKRGQEVKRTSDRDDDGWGGGYYEEIVSTKRDGTSRAICATCGTPHGLKACARCRGIWYCRTEHQAAHWKEHKENCKPAKPKAK